LKDSGYKMNGKVTKSWIKIKLKKLIMS
jgi:hypothetical protein